MLQYHERKNLGHALISNRTCAVPITHEGGGQKWKSKWRTEHRNIALKKKCKNLGHVLVSNLTCGVFIGRTPWRSSTTYPWTEKRRYPKHFSSITQSCPNIPIVDN